MNGTVFDESVCELGEGPLWHPVRQQFFWFDITGNRLLTRTDETQIWDLDENVSAAGWVDQDSLMIATETALVLFDIYSGETEFIAPLEADNALTRSNDGRADPFGGFWIGTMGKNAERKAGAIYRYYRGEVRRLFPKISIPNAICFSPDGLYAYFTDSMIGIIMRQSLDQKDGWPVGSPEKFLDLSGNGWAVDGAVVDAAGNLWNAQWGGWRVACYSAQGDFLSEVKFSAAHTSCPAFGGVDLKDMYCTSARQGLSKQEDAASTDHGKTFVAAGVGKGQAEHQVIL